MPWLLNLLYAIALLAAAPWLFFRALTTGRYRQGWSQKLLGYIPRCVVNGIGNHPVVWLHAVSVGEVQLLKPLLEQLRSKNPALRFVVSSTTQSGMQLAKSLFPGDLLFFFPFDFSWSVKRVMATLKPTLIVLVELELWPNLISAASRRKIPIAVVNARLSAGSFRGYQRLSWLTHAMFGKLRLVAAQDATYAERFVACGASNDRVSVTGSTKFDNVTFDRHCSQAKKLRTLVGLDAAHVVWVVGSTQSPEEVVAAKAFLTLRDTHPLLRLLIVPRHPDRFAVVFRELQAMGVDPLRRSLLEGSVSACDWQVLLVDTVGELRWWWGLADVALVGGSFGSRGGQNMIEPAAYGTNVAFGPNTANFRDICEILLAGGGATRIDSLEQILPWIRQQLEQPEAGNHRGQRAQELVKKHQGALARTVELLQAIIDERQNEPLAGC